ncbi:MAG: hypothetical protein JSU58_11180, partial [Dehalococcoidales bacterium]
HQNQLRMALLHSDSFKAIRGVRAMERSQGVQGKTLIDSIGGGFLKLRPVWKYSFGVALALIIIFFTLFSIPSLGPEKAGVFPEGGHRVFDGPALSLENEEKVIEILNSDSRIQELLGTGAVIEVIMPIEVTAQKINPETGEIDEITELETMAQVWITKGEQQWGVVVDLVEGKIVSLSE